MCEWTRILSGLRTKPTSKLPRSRGVLPAGRFIELHLRGEYREHAATVVPVGLPLADHTAITFRQNCSRCRSRCFAAIVSPRESPYGNTIYESGELRTVTIHLKLT